MGGTQIYNHVVIAVGGVCDLFHGCYGLFFAHAADVHACNVDISRRNLCYSAFASGKENGEEQNNQQQSSAAESQNDRGLMFPEKISQLHQLVDEIRFFLRLRLFRYGFAAFKKGIQILGDQIIFGRGFGRLNRHRFCLGRQLLRRNLCGFLQPGAPGKGKLSFVRKGNLLGGNFPDGFLNILFYVVCFLSAAVSVFRQLAEGFFNLPLLVPVGPGLGKFSF